MSIPVWLIIDIIIQYFHLPPLPDLLLSVTINLSANTIIPLLLVNTIHGNNGVLRFQPYT